MLISVHNHMDQNFHYDSSSNFYIPDGRIYYTTSLFCESQIVSQQCWYSLFEFN